MFNEHLFKIPMSVQPVQRDAVEPLSSKAQRGREVFLEQTRPSCGTCHSLADAKVTGSVGPNLDELRPSLEQIKVAVSKGLGAMPAQTHLTEQQLDDLAHYIVDVTHK